MLSADLDLQGSTTPTSTAIQRLAQSLATSFEQGRVELALFQPPDPLAWNAIAQHIPAAEMQ
ncbi:hypothetical protein [Alteraurantiacibacter aquimixticola]|uniref:Uncharacterized protein n=1 Tax=Alteraurantiacibacter aquimixticola TaxID=2489173 RepID=A0A4T3F0M5_9SPHN|nr:hypothetical protein [Alteraurantiacibacter aquimixticola]TIX50484.1 hypothetical protein E5222_09440 [Alteraurantiacibacter aquimixticola]